MKLYSYLLCCWFCLHSFTLIAQETPVLTVTSPNTELAKLVMDSLSTSSLACTMTRTRLNRRVATIKRNIERVLRSQGYYESSFTTQLVTTENCWQVNVELETGPPVIIEAVNINITGEASADSDFLAFTANPGVASGQILNHASYENLKSELSSLATEKGYFSAQITRSEMLLDLENQKASLEIDFESGSRYHFGKVSINTNGALTEERVKGLLSFREGMLYHSNELIESTQNLGQSMYFSQININPLLYNADDQLVPIEIELVPIERHAFSTGIGYATDSGPIARVSYEDRYFNDRGHRLYSDLSVSKVRTEIDGGINIPLNNGLRNENINFGLGILDENTTSYDSTLTKFAITHRKRVFDDWIRGYFINIEHEEYQINFLPQKSDLLLFGTDLRKTSADNLVNPSKGWSLYGRLSTSFDQLVSNTSFIQLYFKGKHIFSLAERHRLLSRLELGTTFVDNGLDLPASVRFFAGGDQSVRGFKYQALGPVDSSGDVIGGKSLAVASIEYDYRFMENWRAAIFYDTGNAFVSELKGKLVQSAGLGIRWISPIGAIRLDLAFPLDSDGDYKIHITMGPDL